MPASGSQGHLRPLVSEGELGLNAPFSLLFSYLRQTRPRLPRLCPSMSISAPRMHMGDSDNELECDPVDPGEPGTTKGDPGGPGAADGTPQQPQSVAQSDEVAQLRAMATPLQPHIWHTLY